MNFRILHRLLILHDHLNELVLQTQNARHENKLRSNGRYQQVVILAGLHVVRCDFSGEFRSEGGRVIHKISATESTQLSAGFSEVN